MVVPYHFDRQSKTTSRLSFALLLVVLVTFVSASVAQQTGNTGPAEGRQLSLRQQLTTGLRAFTKADFVFIDKVVLAVQQGRLPRKMVDTTFLWARDRAARRSYLRRLRPMVYFAPGLTLRAKQINVTL
ncbi:MAG: hypothetical protein ACR2NM_01770 [Bythopirellula sp.]